MKGENLKIEQERVASKKWGRAGFEYQVFTFVFFVLFSSIHFNSQVASLASSYIMTHTTGTFFSTQNFYQIKRFCYEIFSLGVKRAGFSSLEIVALEMDPINVRTYFISWYTKLN